jgi:hypothetical protein
VVDIAPVAGIDLESFYRRDVQEGAGSPMEQRLWGVKGVSGVPITDGKAQFEYAMSMPMGQQGFGFVAEDNQLVRVRFDDRIKQVNFGGRFFSVGEQFMQSGLARERVQVAGLPGPGAGTEVWVNGRVPKLNVRPSIRRLERTFGDVHLLEERLGASYQHRVGGGYTLGYELESAEVLTEFASTEAFNVRETAAATVRLRTRGWNAFVKHGVVDHAFDTGRIEVSDLWEMGLTLDVANLFTVAPVLRLQARRVDGADPLTARITGLNLSSRWARLPTMNLNVQHQVSELTDGLFEGVGANLNVRTPLRLWNPFPANLTMVASVSYRNTEGVEAQLDEGLGFRLMLEYQSRL